jgi:hypothetical protein
LLVHLAENVRRKLRENVWRFRVIQTVDNAAQQFVVKIQAQRKLVRRLMATFFRLEVEQPGVIAVVRFLEELAKPGVDVVMIRQGLELSIILDAPAFADAQEDNPIDDALDGKVGFALGQLFVA